MTVEVYQSNYAGGLYAYWPREAFEIGTFFSNSSNFTVIDSYTTHYNSGYPGAGPYIPLRYKGDPFSTIDPARITEPYWESDDDIGDADNWFVFQCETSIHDGLPKWQCKVQWNAGYFYDISGVNYGRDGTRRIQCFRFSPYGGWDLEDTNPDFNPTGYPTNPNYRSSGNDMLWVGNTSGHDGRWFFIANDGQLLRFSRRNQDAYDAMYFSGFIGDITPVDDDLLIQPMPRIYMPGYCDIGVIGNNKFLPEGSYVTGWSDTYGGLCYEDQNGDWIEVAYGLPDGTRIINYWSQPNLHASEIQIDTIPYYVVDVYNDNLIGTIPLIARAYGNGFQLFNNKQWLSVKEGYGPIFMWDGNTDLIF